VITLNLFDNVKQDNALIAPLGDGVNGRLHNWQHTTRDLGGFWSASGDWHGPRSEMLEMFLNGVERRIVESAGGLTTWEGFTADLELTLDGQTYIRTLPACANAIRCIYSTIGDNVLSDGSAESAAWAAVGTPSTRERVTTWAVQGTYGMHVVTDNSGEGVEIENGLSITAGVAYQCYVTVKVVSGTWTLTVYNSDDDSIVASRATLDTGRDVLMVRIGDNNTATTVYVRLTADAASREIYADAAVLQTAPLRAETEWYTDADSIAEWGRIEDILLEAAMTDATAEAKVQTELARRAWPRSRPPVQFSIADTGKEDGLSIAFLGYPHTLKWRHLLTHTTAGASTQIATLVGESEFVTAGAIDTNSTSYQIEEGEPIRIWDELVDIIEAGDATGARWMGGVYGGRTFDYEARPTTLSYHYRGGRLLDVHGGTVEPWLARPGLARLDDAPIGPSEITGNIADDPRNVWISEVTFTAPDGLAFKRETLPGEEQ